MESPPSIWSWPQAIIYAVAGAAAATIGAILNHLYNRKKLPSEVRKQEADAGLVEAQADDLRMKTRMSGTEMFSDMAADLNEAIFEKIQLRKKLELKEAKIRLLENQLQERDQLQGYKATRFLEQLSHDHAESTQNDGLDDGTE